MDDKQAQRFGKFLRQQREGLELSIREVASRCGVDHSTIRRLEEGEYAAPAPDKLARLSEVLGLKLADVYAMAGYAVPKELPNPGPYLRTKFRNMPANDLNALQRDVAAVLKRYGIDPTAVPKPGDDAEPGTHKASPKRTRSKKGGTR